MTTTDALRNVRSDLDGLDERTAKLRKDLRKRAEATRDDVMKRTEATREDLVKRTEATRDDLAKRTEATRDDLAKRTEASREQIAALAGDLGETIVERYHEIEDELPTEELAAKAQLGAWRAAQAGLTGLLTLPALAVRGLGKLSTVADELVDRGAEVSERGRELASSVPASKAARRRSRRRTAAVAGIAFLVGTVAGWFLAGRSQTVVTYEPPLPERLDPMADPANPEEPPAHLDVPPAPTSQATTETGDAGILDVRSESERPEPGRGV